MTAAPLKRRPHERAGSCPHSLRGHMTAAPLKPGGELFVAFEDGPLRGHMTAAPLKPGGELFVAFEDGPLRGHMTAAPLKPLHFLEGNSADLFSPRSHDRGPIEAKYTIFGPASFRPEPPSQASLSAVT